MKALALLMAIWAGNAWSHAYDHDERRQQSGGDHEDVLALLVDGANQVLPMRIDQLTVLDRVTQQGLYAQFNYTMHLTAEQAIGIAVTDRDKLIGEIRERSRAEICQSPGMAPVRGMGVLLGFLFTLEDGNYLTKFYVDAAKCDDPGGVFG